MLTALSHILHELMGTLHTQIYVTHTYEHIYIQSTYTKIASTTLGEDPNFLRTSPIRGVPSPYRLPALHCG